MQFDVYLDKAEANLISKQDTHHIDKAISLSNSHLLFVCNVCAMPLIMTLNDRSTMQEKFGAHSTPWNAAVCSQKKHRNILHPPIHRKRQNPAMIRVS